ncbi:MAG: CRISPR-associated endonuclease Cas2 [Pelolinea sp.]|jgi:CRISPR-associated protein Cas2|nr:CRISPR-associated endonuclease Cas2 [Pelolinea sp.]
MAKEKQFIIVVYDISKDKRRTKLHNVLLDYGSPVQYSVFECIIDENTYKKMLKAILKVISPKADHVRLYYVCEGCLKKVKVIGGKDILRDDEPSLLVGEYGEREEGGAD